jgi:septal ring factor EnvC (AmiA/AmiB activator)
MLVKIFYVAGSLFLGVALLGSAGMGVWTYNLNNQLERSQADYQALKSDYDKLDSEYGQAKADYESRLNKAQADLEDERAQTKRLESSLEQAQAENKVLKDKISAIQSKVAMLNAFWFTSDSAFAQRVDSLNDEQLKKLYKAATDSQSWDTFVDLMSYLIQSISETSGISWQPVDIVNGVMPGPVG